MPKNDTLFNTAQKLLGEGKKEDARKILESLLSEDPGNTLVRAWHLEAIEDDSQRLQAAEDWVKLEPASNRARQALIYVLRSQVSNHEERLAREHLEKEKQRLQFETLRKREIQRERAALQAETKSHKQALTRSWVGIFVLMLISLALGVGFLVTGIEASAATSLYTTRNSQYNNVQSQLDQLQSSQSVLQSQLDQSQNALGAMQSQYSTLQTSYDDLNTKYQHLTNIAITPPFIYIHSRDMEIAFVETDQSIHYWEVPFDTLESELSQGDTMRTYAAQPANLLLLNNDAGDRFKIEDFTLFVDPTSFKDVIPDLYNQSGSADAFIREVWNIVTQLDSYSADIGEFPRYPLETFLAGGGDCEDTAILFASMILAAPVQWKVQLVYMDIDHPTNPQTVNHVIVSIDTGQAKYLVETTSSDVMEPYTNGVNGWFYTVGN